MSLNLPVLFQFFKKKKNNIVHMYFKTKSKMWITIDVTHLQPVKYRMH